MKYILMFSIVLNLYTVSVHSNEMVNASLDKVFEYNIEELQDADAVVRTRKCKKYCSLHIKKLVTCFLGIITDSFISGDLFVNGNETIGGNLTVDGNELVKGDVTVLGTLIANIIPIFLGNLTLIGTPQRACIIFRDALLNEKARICSSAIAGDKGVFVSVDGGLTENLRINNEGGSTIVPPTSGPGFSVTGNALAPAIIATGNGTLTAPALSLINNPPASPTDFILTIDPSGAVTESTIPIGNGFIINGCQPGPISIGTSDLTTLTLVTQCLNRLSIDLAGAVTIAQPTAGEALTVDGNIVLPVANGAGTQGLLKLGGTNTTTNVVLYEIGTRNFFAGNGAVNAAVTGANNISIGSNANSTLVAANNAIGIGSSASAVIDSIAIGDQATASAQRTIAIGSHDSTSTGTAPVANAINAIAIGSASGTLAGAVASALSAIALGGSDGVFAGASATGARTVGVGVSATASANNAIAVGSASGVAGGSGPNASKISSIAIGSASGTLAGPAMGGALGLGAIALGSSDGVFAGPLANGNRCIAIGVDAISISDSSILIGSASGVAGGVGPTTGERTAIAIGSAQLAQRAVDSGNISTIAIGGADGVFPGAVSVGTRSIAIGLNANTVGTGALGAIVLGSASGVAGGVGPIGSVATSISIGSAHAANAGALVSGSGGIALGAADSTAIGAVVTAARSVAIGTGASVAVADRIILGNVANTAVHVGIGISAPTSKLHVVGVDGTPVAIFNQVNTAIGNAPVLLNLSSSGAAGTPLHINGSNQVFAFTSSERYKTNIRTIDTESEIIYQLYPVFYNSKKEYGQSVDIPGFIAEQVWHVAPNLVILNSDNEPINVAYNSLHAFVIKEIQKHHNQLKYQAHLLNENAIELADILEQTMQLQTQVSAYEMDMHW